MRDGGDCIKARTISLAAAGLCLLFLLAGLARTILSPDTEIAYENRPANRLPAFSASAFLRGEFQDGFEDALADQIPMAIRMKKLYNIFDTGAALPVIRALGRDGLRLHVSEDNAPALAFYRKHGFENIGMKKGILTDLFLMEKEL